MESSKVIREESILYVGDSDVIHLSSSESDGEVHLCNSSEKNINYKKKRMEDFDTLISVSSDSKSEVNEDILDNHTDMFINIHSVESDGNVSDVNTNVTVRWNEVESPNSWTKEMRRYYNKPCKRQRYFDWKKVLTEIRSGHPPRWNIRFEDRFPPLVRRRRCELCRQTGHMANTCPRKNGTCFMCGIPGHFHLMCPRRSCLNCGLQNLTFSTFCRRCSFTRDALCHGCQRRGHEFNSCPDLWRRYHCTVPHKEINSTHTELNSNIQCCNCAMVGHLYEECKQRLWSPYPPVSCIVKNYDDTYAGSSAVNHPTSYKRSREYYSDETSEESFNMLANFKKRKYSKISKLFIKDTFSCFGDSIKKKKKKKKRSKKRNQNNSL